MSKDRLLIAVDLDGTLLTDAKTISERTKKALQEAIRQGHKVAISTGRPFRSSKDYYQELSLDTPIVNFNGALVHHPLDTEWGFFHSPLDKETANDIIDSAKDYNVQNILMEVIDEVYLHKHDPQLMNTFFDPSVEINWLSKKLDKNPTSVLIHPHEHNASDLREHLEHNHAEVIEHRKWGAPWNVIEIIRAGLNKAVGVERIANYYHIRPENIIAFGDEDNDFEMIEFAGTGVAMGNGIDELKERANVITETNEKDGIARFLEKEVL